MRPTHALFACLLLAALAPAAAYAQDPAQSRQSTLTVRPRFEGAAYLGRDSVAVRVDVRMFSIPGRQKLDALPLPFRGTLVVELRGGELATVIDGRRVERREGEVWLVPPGSAMRLETEDDTAVIQVTLLQEP